MPAQQPGYYAQGAPAAPVQTGPSARAAFGYLQQPASPPGARYGGAQYGGQVRGYGQYTAPPQRGYGGF
jgi:hypothetical protein